MKTLRIEPLTREAFAPFGDVIEASDAVRHFPINGGTTERYHDLANIEFDAGSKPIISIFRGQPRTLPYTVTKMERHPHGSQAFVPMSGKPYLVAVAERGNRTLTPDDIRVFLARSDQGVNYATGVWHHPLLALETVCDFLVVDRSGSTPNCDEVPLSEPALINALP